MRSCILLAPLFFSSVLALGLEDEIARQVLAARHPVDNAPGIVARAATSASTAAGSSSITDIISLITPGCSTTCNLFITDLSSCASLASGAAIASCACSSQTLGDIRGCASCVAADNSTATPGKAQVVNDYNSFVNLCQSQGLAIVTGTVSVGASTSSLVRTILSPSSTIPGATTSAPPKNATYQVEATTVAATNVQALTFSGLSGSPIGAASSTAKGSTSTAPAAATKTGDASMAGVKKAAVLLFGAGVGVLVLL